MRLMICAIALAVSALFLFSTPGVATAQSEAATQDAGSSVTPQKIGELSDQLTPDQRQVLAELLELMVAESGAPSSIAADKPGFSEALQAIGRDYGNFLWVRITGFSDGLASAADAVAQIFSGRGVSGVIGFLGALVLMIAVAAGAEFLTTRIVRSSRESEALPIADNLLGQLKSLGIALGRDLAGLVAFTIVAFIAARILFDAADFALVSGFVIYAILLVRFAAALLRFVLAPNDPRYRLVTTDDWTAKFIYYGLVAAAGVVGVALFVGAAIDHYGTGDSQLFSFWVGVFLYLSVIYITWRARNGLTSIIRGDDDDLTPGLERMATWWPPVSIALIIIQYIAAQIARATGALDIQPGAAVTVLAIIVLAPFLDTMMRGLVRHLVPPMQGEGQIAEAAYDETRRSYVRIGRVILFALIILVVGRLLGLSFQNIAQAGLGVQIAAKGVGFLMIVAVGYLIWEVVNLSINKRLAGDISEAAAEGLADGEGFGAGKSRMATVLPLLKMTLQITIIMITILLALAQLGVNITPLLAGAGVLGLAIGFGAQTLVKDVVSGVFFLLDDAFRVGEYIDVGGTMGTVEKISVRSLQMRHPNGPVHIVPYGEIAKLTNHGRDYVIMKLKFTLPFDTDLEKVRKMFKKIGQEMMEVPALAENFLMPFKSQGVAEVNDVGIVMRGKFTAKPGTQWVIRKEIYARVHKAFEANDVHFARREVRVQVNGSDEDEMSEADKKAVAAAAESAISAPKA